MKKLSPLNWIVFAVGAAVLILCFFMLLAPVMQTDVFWLDLCVSLIIYGLFYFRAVKPMVNLDDPAQREVSYLGFSFASIGIYAAAAIFFMLATCWLDFKYQLLIQIILAFLLLLAFMVGTRMSEKTVEVFNNEQRLLDQLDNLRREMSRLDRTMAMSPGIPAQIKGQVSDLMNQVRYIAPCNNVEARDLEVEMTIKVQRINSLCSDYEANADSIPRALNGVAHILQERKAIRST